MWQEGDTRGDKAGTIIPHSAIKQYHYSFWYSNTRAHWITLHTERAEKDTGSAAEWQSVRVETNEQTNIFTHIHLCSIGVCCGFPWSESVLMRALQANAFFICNPISFRSFLFKRRSFLHTFGRAKLSRSLSFQLFTFLSGHLPGNCNRWYAMINRSFSCKTAIFVCQTNDHKYNFGLRK